jgi:16S rRNA (cytidine1402-2'-O)-methyltransferase
MAGILYIVATPIGNLSDITLRAISTLKSADLIACEDTRHTSILLKKYEIEKPTTSYHKFNTRTKTTDIISVLRGGSNVALVSDAGTPGISDPGYELIKKAIEAGIKVEAIPGPSSVITALAVSGLPTDRFVFEGFLPLKGKEREDRLKALSTEDRTIVFFEAPHRIRSTLADIKEVLGIKQVAVTRELTKKFETVTRGNITEVIDQLTDVEPLGEYVVVMEGTPKTQEYAVDPVPILKEMLAAGVSKSMAVKIISKTLGVHKNELYRQVLADKI